MPKNKNKKEKKIEEFSSEVGNMSVVEKEENKEGLSIDKKGLKVGKSSNLIIGKININPPFKENLNKNHKDNSKFHLIVDSIMGLIIITLLVFVLWLSFWQPKNNIIVSSQTDGFVSSGGIETLTINYETKTKLKNTSLSLNLPNNFILLDVLPKNIFNSSTNTFTLGNLHSGANGEIKISGYVLGEVGASQVLGHTFNCKTCGVNGIMNSLAYNIEDSVLEMRIIKPEIFYSKLGTPIEIILKNNGQKNLDDLSIKINNNWRILDNENIFNNRIILDHIKKGETKKIFLSLLPLSVDSNLLELELFLEKNGRIYLQDNFSSEVTISNPKLKTNLETAVKSINPKERINFSLEYNNQEEISLNDLNFKLRASNGFKIKNLSLRESNSTIDIVEDLLIIKKDILPGEKKIIFLSAEVENPNTQKNKSFKILTETNYSLVDHSLSYQTSSKDIKLSSNLTATAKIYYYSPQGDQIGIGPLPPKVALTTTYWLFLEFNNQGNDLTDFSLTGKLSDSVFWANRKSFLEGALNFNSINNRFAWDIDVINFSQTAQAKIAVNLLPKEHMTGNIVNLVENITLKAYDSFTEEWINISLANVNTNLKADNLATGQGVVQP